MAQQKKVQLELEDVCCGYGGEPVVQHVSFSVAEGEKLCILGANGCGKTTLLRAICGLLSYTGSIRACGMQVRGAKRRALARRIALMSQGAGADFAYTVYDTVLMGRYAHGAGVLSSAGADDRAAAEDCLRRCGLWEMRDRLITRLSGGQLQRVFLARTFAQDPAVILLDEPTSHLDLKYQLEMVDLLQDWVAKGGRSVVGVLHDVNLALRLADSLLLMSQGRVLAHLPQSQLQSSQLEQVYGVDVAGYMRQSLQYFAP